MILGVNIIDTVLQKAVKMVPPPTTDNFYKLSQMFTTVHILPNLKLENSLKFIKLTAPILINKN
jgi:hypothetical protein